MARRQAVLRYWMGIVPNMSAEKSYAYAPWVATIVFSALLIALNYCEEIQMRNGPRKQADEVAGYLNVKLGEKLSKMGGHSATDLESVAVLQASLVEENNARLRACDLFIMNCVHNQRYGWFLITGSVIMLVCTLFKKRANRLCKPA
jgi:hypothetical protein